MSTFEPNSLLLITIFTLGIFGLQACSLTTSDEEEVEGIDNTTAVKAIFETDFDDSFEDRSSWDQIAVLYGVRGSDKYFEEVGTDTGRLANGYQWNMQPGYRMYLTHKLPTSQMVTIIEELMIQAPGSAPDRKQN